MKDIIDLKVYGFEEMRSQNHDIHKRTYARTKNNNVEVVEIWNWESAKEKRIDFYYLQCKNPFTSSSLFYDFIDLSIQANQLDYVDLATTDKKIKQFFRKERLEKIIEAV